MGQSAWSDGDLTPRTIERLEARAVLTGLADVKEVIESDFFDAIQGFDNDVTSRIAALNAAAQSAASQVSTITQSLPANISQTLNQQLTSAINTFANTFGNTVTNWIGFSGPSFSYTPTLTGAPGWMPGMIAIGGDASGMIFPSGYFYASVDKVFSFTPNGEAPGTVTVKWNGNSVATSNLSYSFTQPLVNGRRLVFQGSEDFVNNRANYSYQMTTPEMAFSSSAMREGSTITQVNASFDLTTTNGLVIKASTSENAASGSTSTASVSKNLPVGSGVLGFEVFTGTSSQEGTASGVGATFTAGNNRFDLIGITNNPVLGPAFSGVTARWNLESDYLLLRIGGSQGVRADNNSVLIVEMESWMIPSTTLPGSYWKLLDWRVNVGLNIPIGNQDQINDFLLMINTKFQW